MTWFPAHWCSTVAPPSSAAPCRPCNAKSPVAVRSTPEFVATTLKKRAADPARFFYTANLTRRRSHAASARPRLQLHRISLFHIVHAPEFDISPMRVAFGAEAVVDRNQREARFPYAMRGRTQTQNVLPGSSVAFISTVRCRTARPPWRATLYDVRPDLKTSRSHVGAAPKGTFTDSCSASNNALPRTSPPSPNKCRPLWICSTVVPPCPSSRAIARKPP